MQGNIGNSSHRNIEETIRENQKDTQFFCMHDPKNEEPFEAKYLEYNYSPYIVLYYM